MFKFRQYLDQYAFIGLMISLIFLLIVPSYWQSAEKTIIIGVLVSITLVSYLALVVDNKLKLAVGAVLAVPMMLQIWGGVASPEQLPSLTLTVLTAVFFAYIAVEIGRKMLFKQHVTLNVIAASVSVYFLIGVAFSYIYMSLEISHPGSIGEVAGLQGPELFNQLLYFSFVTLTTLGYGDISPDTSIAQHWAILQAILGQFYLAVLVARLVSLYSARSNKES